MVSSPDPRLTLGSASPRRAALLRSIGVSFVVETVDIDEASLLAGCEGNPDLAVTRIAQAKFAAFSTSAGATSLLLTADTLVACDGVILGKPGSPDDLVHMMQHMSGRALTIATAACFGDRGTEPDLWLVTTTVSLRDLSPAEIQAYVATGVGSDKAAGLALQAEAGAFIDHVEGCWSNVLGLPLCAVRVMLGRAQGDDRVRHEWCSAELCGSRPSG